VTVFIGLVYLTVPLTRSGCDLPEFSPDRPAPMEIVVHSYLFHLGDYGTHTSHLTLMEDLAYRRLIDLYYLHESPPMGTPEQISRRIRMPKEVNSVQQVLNEFFEEELSDSGDNPFPVWRNKRCDEEIEKFQALKEHGRKGAAKRWDKGWDRGAIATPLGSQSQPNANHNHNHNHNHKPETNNSRARGTRFQQQVLPDEWVDFCRQERPDLNPQTIFAQFSDYWSSLPGSKGVRLDWTATWRNWVRNQKQPTAKLSGMNKDEAWEFLMGRSDKIIDMEAEDVFSPKQIR
jgi:uncharacterized protein YdaU (DUF1376 family)